MDTAEGILLHLRRQTPWRCCERPGRPARRGGRLRDRSRAPALAHLVKPSQVGGCADSIATWSTIDRLAQLAITRRGGPSTWERAAFGEGVRSHDPADPPATSAGHRRL